eukprot:TRINITY_DN44425_c0_g1_i1.p1 TRINITY_DN44425_c0_g1~~TRINITY_DN44425_c0_g1_i1.p1  ORF type:complete len:194 (-),score=26.22 TRINITY_DN44425_c0_g1_i1:347-874(-)
MANASKTKGKGRPPPPPPKAGKGAPKGAGPATHSSLLIRNDVSHEIVTLSNVQLRGSSWLDHHLEHFRYSRADQTSLNRAFTVLIIPDGCGGATAHCSTLTGVEVAQVPLIPGDQVSVIRAAMPTQPPDGLEDSIILRQLYSELARDGAEASRARFALVGVDGNLLQDEEKWEDL